MRKNGILYFQPVGDIYLGSLKSETLWDASGNQVLLLRLFAHCRFSTPSLPGINFMNLSTRRVSESG